MSSAASASRHPSLTAQDDGSVLEGDCEGLAALATVDTGAEADFLASIPLDTDDPVELLRSVEGFVVPECFAEVKA